MSMEWNKIFGAVLLAGLIAMLTGFMSEVLVHPKTPEKAAYVIAVPESKGGDTKGGGGAPAGPGDIAPLLAKADPAAGQAAAKACASCHSFDKGAAAKVGPNLYGIVGSKHGHMEGFAYSDAIKGHAGNWDYAELNKFIYDPKAYAPGTKMTFAGVKKDQERANIIAYLRSLSDSPAPLPQ
ncbi:c-type cytochrome [Azospirillum canadense]|uniref:c-type cytochrome n=1 Tax=Azospirillum canadense TaxID=403962 RepID=UPI0022262ACF|nr:cytochrome c family protein [Azospirillum canadense]MCW2238074.1 cytochrome c [Azospirillum canadense]